MKKGKCRCRNASENFPFFKQKSKLPPFSGKRRRDMDNFKKLHVDCVNGYLHRGAALGQKKSKCLQHQMLSIEPRLRSV